MIHFHNPHSAINKVHTVTFSEELFLRGFALKKGVAYIMANSMAGGLLTNHQLVTCQDGQQRPVYRLVEASAWPERPIDPTQDYNDRDIWIFRMGGFGDVMMATPTIREIKRRWPRCRVHFVTMLEYAAVLQGVDCQTHTGFVSLIEIGAGDPLIFFEGVIEDNPRAREIHAVDLLAERAGVPLAEDSDRRLSYYLAKSEREWAHSNFSRSGRRRIGIQAASSSGVRSYEPRLMVKVIESLVAQDIEVFVFGKAGQVDCKIEGVVNVASFDLSFRQSVSVLSTCDVALVPDSSLHHVAAALDIPTVAIFGSFPSALRVIPGAPVTVLEAKGDCAPCHHHESGNSRFPENAPCSLTVTRESPGFCTVLAGINPSRVVDACLAAIPKAKTSDGVREVVVYDFKDHRIGDTVAAAYLLKIFKADNPNCEIRIIDRGALSCASYFPKTFHCWSVEFPDRWLNLRRLNFEFGNLWLAAPSAFKDTQIAPEMFVLNGLEEEFDVGVHCLTDAGYNTARNHDPGQFARLVTWLEESGKRVFQVPADPTELTVEAILRRIHGCKMWIGGDTGFSHCFAAMHPNRPIIGIYGNAAHDYAGFENERLRMRAWWEPGNPAGLSSSWCSDPLSFNLQKFVMNDHLFNRASVEKAVLAKL